MVLGVFMPACNGLQHNTSMSKVANTAMYHYVQMLLMCCDVDVDLCNNRSLFGVLCNARGI